MEQINVNTMIQEMANLQVMLQSIQAENATLRARIDQIQVNPAMIPQAAERLEPVNITYTNPTDINLDVFKALPVFDGNISKYRVWREDVSRLMDGISNHRNSIRYVEALSIIKTKIQGAAADVLINHNTIFNFDTIRNRLDYTYADQRPLYVLQDEMKRLTQGKHNLSEFHDNVNRALTLITSKISMSGHSQEVIKVMTDEATQEAVRVFKDGINNSYIRSTLYGNPIRDLEHAFAVARTIEHDDEQRKLRLGYAQQNIHPTNNKHYYEKQHHQRRPMYQQKYNYNQPPSQLPKPEPMDTTSGNTTFRQPTQHQNNYYDVNRNNKNWKRPRGNSGQFTNQYQQPKLMRNNNLTSEEDNSSTIVETGRQNHLVIKYLNLINGLPSIVMNDGKVNYKVLVDTGATHNYVKKTLKFNITKKVKPLQVISMHGNSIINTKQTIKFMNEDLDFFEVDEINGFDLILGWNGIKKLNVVINLNKMTLEMLRKSEISEKIMQITL